ncbi:MAG: hypothetical protein RR057_03730, partial [Clostridia bacterium]
SGISAVSINDKFISDIFDKFICDFEKTSSCFFIYDVSRKSLLTQNYFAPRPNDLIYISAFPTPKALKKYKCDGIFDLIKRSYSFCLDMSNIPEELFYQTFYVIPQAKLKKLSLLCPLTEIGIVTSDGVFRFHSETDDYEYARDTLQERLLSPPPILINGTEFFLLGFLDYTESLCAMFNSNENVVKITYKSFYSLSDMLAYKLGVYWGETLFGINSIYGISKPKNYLPCDGDTIYFAFPKQIENGLPTFNLIRHGLFECQNAIKGGYPTYAHIVRADDLNEFIDSALGASFILKNAVYPFPFSNDGGITIITKAILPLPILGKISKSM